MRLKTFINGIDVDRQRALAINAARVTWPLPAICTEWVGGTQTRTVVSAPDGRETARQFAIQSDYPTELLGSGTAPSPLEMLVVAISSSFVSTLVLAATQEGLRIESLSVRAITGIQTGASAQGRQHGDPGGTVELCAAIDADAPAADLWRLAALALDSSPVGAVCGLSVGVQLEAAERGIS